MNIKNASMVSTLHNVLTDLKIRQIGGELTLEATTPPMLHRSSAGPSFLLFDTERQFAVVLQEAVDYPGVLFSPIILAELNPSGDYDLNPAKTLRLNHSEIKEMSLLIAYWFMRARSGMTKDKVLQFLRTTYADVAAVQWGNMSEPMEDMERFLRNLKVAIPA